jgi:hypothetical protein
MKKVSENGMPIDTQVLNFLNRGVQREGRQSKFARLLGVTEMSLSTWLKKTKIDTSCIAWDQWAKIRTYLVDIGDIQQDDPQWMLPSELRDEVYRLRAITPTGIEAEILPILKTLTPEAQKHILHTVSSLAKLMPFSNSDESAI